ncbi:MAG: SPOR domain-containing protein [Erythrobacter sp.]
MSAAIKNKQAIAPKVALAVTTALASVALAGCTTSAAPVANSSFNKAQTALAQGKVDKAVVHAEAAVLAEPRNASYRAMLGAAYLESGRFNAAATSFDDALSLGDSDPRTVLSYSLAKIALGDNGAAVEKLDLWQNDIDPADLGLAYALAGDANRGVHIIGNALRAGQNTAKVRQNLAYTYALQGNWRGARVMAAEDVPADQLDARITEWAHTGKPEDYQRRVAGLLQVDPVYDAGQPTHLALGNFPSQEMMVAEAATQVPAVEDTAETAELAFVEPVQEAPVVAPVVTAPVVAAVTAAPAPIAAPVSQSQRRYVSNAVVQSLPTNYSAASKGSSSRPAKAPTSRVAAVSSQRRMASTADRATDTHLVQLGSFNDEASAKRAWSIYVKRYPELSNRDMVVTEAQVDGKTFFRVAAAGFGANSAQAMCSTVQSSGNGCIAYAKSTPLPGAVKTSNVRIASR